jgi:hypothetical protein
MEWDHFPLALIERLNKLPGFEAELAQIDATPEIFTRRYSVLVDRISHEVPFYRFHLKAAALAGTYVVNDPFWWSADEKFFGFSLAAKVGVPTPKTVLLPQCEYLPSIDPQRSLKNLVYPLDWEGITRYVGFPAILKPADGGGWKNVFKVDDMAQLLAAYNQTGQIPMTLQEFIDFDEYVRCICIGKDQIRPIRYDPRQRCYLPDQGYMSAELEGKVVEYARALNNALGYDMNSVEFAIRDGVPYAIDFTNPAPDMYPHHILPDNYEWCLQQMTALCVKAATEGLRVGAGYSFQRYLDRMTASAKPAASAEAVSRVAEALGEVLPAVQGTGVPAVGASSSSKHGSTKAR